MLDIVAREIGREAPGRREAEHYVAEIRTLQWLNDEARYVPEIGLDEVTPADKLAAREVDRYVIEIGLDVLG